jgi:hypothetical protein
LDGCVGGEGDGGGTRMVVSESTAPYQKGG